MRSWSKVVLIAVGVVTLAASAFAADTKKVEPKQLSGEDLKMAQEMNAAYARHMYNSACLMRQKTLYLPKILTDKEKEDRIKGFVKSCDCLADMSIKQTSPNDVIDFITRNFGSHMPKAPSDKKNSASTPKPTRSPQFDKIGVILRSKETRKSCGLSP